MPIDPVGLTGQQADLLPIPAVKVGDNSRTEVYEPVSEWNVHREWFGCLTDDVLLRWIKPNRAVDTREASASARSTAPPTAATHVRHPG